jgi:hypothetical protein
MNFMVVASVPLPLPVHADGHGRLTTNLNAIPSDAAKISEDRQRFLTDLSQGPSLHERLLPPIPGGGLKARAPLCGRDVGMACVRLSPVRWRGDDDASNCDQGAKDDGDYAGFNDGDGFLVGLRLGASKMTRAIETDLTN